MSAATRDDPWRVLHLIDTLEVGGAESSLLAILSRFRVFRPVMCHIYPGAQLRPAYEAAGSEVVSLDIPGRYSLLGASRAVRAVIRNVRPALVHSTLFRADLVARVATLGSGVPLVSSFVNDSYSSERMLRLGRTGRWKLELSRVIDAASSRRVQRFTANSAAIRTSNARALHLDETRIQVIHRGRDPRLFSTLNLESRLQKRHQLGCSGGQPLLLNTSRHLQRKGLFELLEAFALVRAEWPEAVLLLAGDGPVRPRLEQRAAELDIMDSVRFLGMRSDVAELLQVADLFVFPSHYEGHPGALIEAMMASLPIVASDIDVHRETLIDDRSAIFIPIASPPDLAQAISSSLTDFDGARRRARRAHEIAIERFDVEHIAAEHEKLYSDLLSTETKTLDLPSLPPRRGGILRVR
jgi:glycosyltransferase involved in cell wall biosynthesis